MEKIKTPLFLLLLTCFCSGQSIEDAFKNYPAGATDLVNPPHQKHRVKQSEAFGEIIFKEDIQFELKEIFLDSDIYIPYRTNEFRLPYQDVIMLQRMEALENEISELKATIHKLSQEISILKAQRQR